MKSSNVQALDKLLHKDLLFIVPSGETITKEMDLETYRSGMLKIDTLTPAIEALNIIDDLAIVTVQIKLNGNYRGQAFEAQYKYIRFWKKFADGIKVIGGSGSSV